jgi:hypothetical protein
MLRHEFAQLYTFLIREVSYSICKGQRLYMKPCFLGPSFNHCVLCSALYTKTSRFGNKLYFSLLYSKLRVEVTIS